MNPKVCCRDNQSCLWYTTSEYHSHTGYKDSNFAGNIGYIKITSRYAFHFGTNLISCASKKQPIVAISSIEKEYVVATSTSFQVVWMRRLLNDIAHMEKEPNPIFCDNKSTISLSKNNVFHMKRKSIDTRFQFIQELVNNGDVSLQLCGSRDQLTYIFTKPLGKSVFEFQRKHLGILSVDECNS
jgi:hypothetical protein